MEIRKHGEESHMFRFFQPRVYVVAATLLCATVGAGGVWAVHWAHGGERLKLESCQRLLTAPQLERPIQVRGLLLKGPGPCRRLDAAANALHLPREVQFRGDPRSLRQ